jgi:hypothetical protein
MLSDEPEAERFEIAVEADLSTGPARRGGQRGRPDRHALTIDSGWREVAETALALVKRFV